MAGDRRSTGFEADGALLGQDDPSPIEVVNPQGRSPFLLVGDHCGICIPRVLGDLGLGIADRERHIGWDIGTAALGEALATRLDAVFLRQAYSRLVIDCNRDPTAPDAIPEVSDGTPIPGNTGLTAADREARIAAIHAPYQQAIADRIAGRAETILISLHSFTPEMDGFVRPWDVGVLHDGRNDGFARAVLARLGALPGIVVGNNEPYRMDAIDHTVPRHAFATDPSAFGLPYVELEVAQRRLIEPGGIAAWCEFLAEALTTAL